MGAASRTGCALPREVFAAMRAELGPRRLLCARLNGDDLLPGGLEIDDYCKVASALAEAGLDLIHVSAGTYRVMERRIPPMYLTGETFAGYAQAIRQAAKLPVIASGTIHDPTEANRLIADGEADFVSMARPMFADPALANKLLRDRPREVLPCIRCNTCLAREQGGARGYCAVNPKTGREFELQMPPARSQDDRHHRRGPRRNPDGPLRSGTRPPRHACGKRTIGSAASFCSPRACRSNPHSRGCSTTTRARSNAPTSLFAAARSPVPIRSRRMSSCWRAGRPGTHLDGPHRGCQRLTVGSRRPHAARRDRGSCAHRRRRT